MASKKDKVMTQEQLDAFLSGMSGYEAMGNKKSPGAGRQGLFSRAAEQLMRKNPEMFDDMVDRKKTQKYAPGGRVEECGGDVRYNRKRGKTY